MNTMKALSPETKDTSKQQRRRLWLGCFTILLVSPLLLYYGYCWGLWGRQSLLLQYLFQCSCPPASEEVRYPEDVDVVVSACRYSGSILAPSGRLLYVIEQNSKFSSTYLLDLQSNEKIPFAIGQGSNYFLTDDLLFLSLHYGRGYEGGDYILDRTTGKQYPIQRFISLRSDALYPNGDLNLEVLTMELQDAQDVYLIDDDIIVALKSDFQTFPERNFYIDQRVFPGRDPNRGEQFLQENGIDYHALPGRFQEEALSPDGRLIAREDGIYLAGSGEKIVESYTARGITGKYFSVQGWASDSSGVIYYKFLDACLLQLPSYDGGTCSIPVPQPLIKLKVPEEYLLLRATP